MACAALLLGLLLPVFARGLVQQTKALRLEQRSGPQSKATKDSERGPETYGSWDTAWTHGTEPQASEVLDTAYTIYNRSANARLASDGLIRSCFKEACNKWRDDEGEPIEAHGAGLLKDPLSGRWYWYGESRKTKDLRTHGINCYSAESLGGPWKREGVALTQMDSRAQAEDSSPQVMRQSMIDVKDTPGPFVVERPKVLFNEKTKKYVMWFHLDDSSYRYRHVGVATADSPAGPFTFVHAIRPDGIPSLDMSLWMDVDGEAYFIRSCDNNYTGISRLTDDYLNSTGLISKGPRLEGMALFRIPNGTLYMITSQLTGWQPNPLMLYRASGKDLSDPRWQELGNPTRDELSYNSQPTYVVPYTTQNGETYFIYMADNWIHAGYQGLLEASYVWLPIRFESGFGGAVGREAGWSGRRRAYSKTVIIDKLAVWDMEDPWKGVQKHRAP